MKRLGVSLLSFGLFFSGLPAAMAEPPPVEDRLRAFSIVPPGQEGDVTAQELVTGDYGPHYSDQLGMYASLVNDDDVTEKELPNYFHSMAFGPQGEVEDEYEPTEGATVYRDSLGIPHIYAKSLNKASFALGYVTAEDRMWQMDVFRHAARGTLAEFVGPSFLQMDIDTRREGYTEKEVQKMFDSFDDKFGKVGVKVQKGLQAYADGVNAHIDELKSNRVDEMPAEYPLASDPPPLYPEEWSPIDTLYLAILQLRVFGETAGGEMQNAALYSQLQKTLGHKKGDEAFGDFLRNNDPRSYTSIQRSEGAFPSQDLGRPNPAAIAIPDQAEETAEELAAIEQRRDEFLAKLGLKTPASNALIVSAGDSATGNPLQIGAPQVGYANPAFFIDIDVHAPGIDFRGPAVPGASALIPLGRGADYAWSLTTGYSDAVDVRAELLCHPKGKEVKKSSRHYMFKGKCTKMESREESFFVKPSLADPGLPDSTTRTFHRTVHGPVFTRGTVDDKPVAFVKQRFFWKKELDSLPSFYRWNTSIDSLSDFAKAARDFTMSFNTVYADAKHIGYFHVGMYPKRAKGVHPALPVWGTGKWEWQGRFPYARHPKIVDPKQGWVANWNNKPARGWDNFDAPKWGPVSRVELLADQMKRLLAGSKKAELSDLVDGIRRVATQDARGLYLGPKLLRSISVKRGSQAAEAATLVSNWIKAGAHRYDRDADEQMDDGAAVAIFDSWYLTLVHAVFDDELGEAGFDALAAPIQHRWMWFDYSSYLANLFDGRLSRNYCDVLTTKARETCRGVATAAFEAAVAKLTEDQGEDLSVWTAPAGWIEFSNQGAGDVPGIPWQNRGTHNHVVEILSNVP
ncbi:MAG: penicillin acylase family protein [Actinomycetota bacterium]|nr:penicillin acylase family protein [Actinomycetota bacterium]